MKFSIYHWMKNVLQKHFWLSVLIFVVLFFFVSVFIIYYFERDLNSELTIIESFRIVLALFLGEYGDAQQTDVGKFISVMVFILGIVTLATLVGRIAALFVELKMEVKMPKDLEKHIVICNWHSNADRIVKELHSPLAAPEKDILVITEAEINETELRMSPEYEKVFFIRSDPTLHVVLKRAQVQQAESVIILSDHENSDPDAKAALISLAITKLYQNMPQKPRIVAEISNPHKVHHLMDAGVDEWVCAADYGLGIIAQAALFGKLSDVYQQLLTYSEETNEIYLLNSDKYPQWFQGKKFEELAEILIKGRSVKNPTILVGIKREAQVLLNPKEDEFDQLKPDDSLVVMAFDPPDLNYL
ncbi:MAG: potassium transporter [Candidatus Parabeggiatoa sp. nov. 1]|nr:MAG: potassium transporter [Gammaproteobacteria bacterium]